MDVSVQTGVTRTTGDNSVVARSFTSKDGEQVLFLLQTEGGKHNAEEFQDECERVLRHALLDSEGETWTRLDGTLKELNGLMKGVLLSHTFDDMHAIVAIVQPDGMLHVSHAGRGEGYLVRGNSASQITEFSRGKPLAAFVHISSGPLEPMDTVVFSTQRLLRSFTPTQLAQLAQHGDRMLPEVTAHLEADEEEAAVGVVAAGGGAKAVATTSRASAALPSRRTGKRPSAQSSFSSILSQARHVAWPFLVAVTRRGVAKLSANSTFFQRTRERVDQFIADLRHPERKRRAHLLLLAGAVGVFLVIFLVVRLSVSSERSKTRAELSDLVQKVNDEIKMADNKQLAGDIDAANEILQRADASAKQVMDNESGLFRVEALDLLDRIRAEREKINNIVRFSPRVLVNLSAKNASVSAQGILGVSDGEFIVYDRQSWYHVLLNGVDDPKKLSDDGLIIDGASFPRYKAQVFLTTGSAVVELQSGQPISMKTEDPSGWVAGKDIEAYLRYLYILSSDNKIYKYERLTNRYSTSTLYNVSGDLTGAIDMTIDSSVYILKDGGAVVKLFRGEAKPFSILHAPPDLLKTATKLAKVSGGNFYFLDPAKNRIIVSSQDDATTGESTYLKQYVLEGDQLGKLQDLAVDPDEAHAYVVDEKRVYVIDLVK